MKCVFLENNFNPTLCSIVLGVCLSGACTPNSQDIESAPPNIIMIFTDDLGYGDLSCYGANKVNTPMIDQLAEEGRMFSDAHSASAVCTPSRYALLTGKYPLRENLFRPYFHEIGLLIDTSQFTIADLMKKSGYSTACIGKWHLGFGLEEPDWNGDLKPGPLELGFDYYYGIPVVNSHPPFVYVENHHVVGLDPEDPIVFNQRAETREFQEKFFLDQIGGAKAAHALYDDEMVGTHLTTKAVEWIRSQKNNPFFLYFATPHIHHPFTPHPRFQGSSKCGRYGDFIHELDWMVGEIMRILDELHLSDNTLVIFTSDNGGMLNQGGQDAWTMGHRMNGELFGFKFDAWEGGHRVPFIVRWPGKVEAGTKSDQLISNIDMLATIADLVGYELKEGEGPDSYNVLPAFIGNPKEHIRDHLVVAPFRETHLSLRQGDWMFISEQGGGGFSNPTPGSHAFGGPAATLFAGRYNSDIEGGVIKPDAPKQQLYNLAIDPFQTVNVIRENPDIADKMKVQLQEIRKSRQTRP